MRIALVLALSLLAGTTAAQPGLRNVQIARVLEHRYLAGKSPDQVLSLKAGRTLSQRYRKLLFRVHPERVLQFGDRVSAADRATLERATRIVTSAVDGVKSPSGRATYDHMQRSAVEARTAEQHAAGQAAEARAAAAEQRRAAAAQQRAEAHAAEQARAAELARRAERKTILLGLRGTALKAARGRSFSAMNEAEAAIEKYLRAHGDHVEHQPAVAAMRAKLAAGRARLDGEVNAVWAALHQVGGLDSAQLAAHVARALNALPPDAHTQPTHAAIQQRVALLAQAGKQFAKEESFVRSTQKASATLDAYRPGGDVTMLRDLAVTIATYGRYARDQRLSATARAPFAALEARYGKLMAPLTKQLSQASSELHAWAAAARAGKPYAGRAPEVVLAELPPGFQHLFEARSIVEFLQWTYKPLSEKLAKR